MVNAEDVKVCQVCDQKGKRYRSMHDARPTAPNGTIWRVSRVDAAKGTVNLWAFNAWGRLHQETAKLEQLFELEEKANA